MGLVKESKLVPFCNWHVVMCLMDAAKLQALLQSAPTLSYRLVVLGRCVVKFFLLAVMLLKIILLAVG
jgi:hypothetical protein